VTSSPTQGGRRTGWAGIVQLDLGQEEAGIVAAELVDEPEHALVHDMVARLLDQRAPAQAFQHRLGFVDRHGVFVLRAHDDLRSAR
jgi:hypothetical protein